MKKVIGIAMVMLLSSFYVQADEMKDKFCLDMDGKLECHDLKDLKNVKVLINGKEAASFEIHEGEEMPTSSK